MKSKIKLKYILLAIGVLCVVAGLILIFTTPLGSVLARKAETFQLLIDRQIGDAHRLEMTNAYGNNSAYHPSVINFKEKWNGYKYWMSHTPYPNADDGQENPHIMVSNDLENWVEPKGFKNPLEPAPENFIHTKIYNSDSELVYNTETKELECWWRFVDDVEGLLIIYRKTTKDGINWSEKEVVLESEDRNKNDWISPALVFEDGKYKMWYVGARYTLYYIETVDLENWSEPVEVKIEYENPKLKSWHLDVIHENGLYEMVVNAFIEGKTRRTLNLYYTNSKDNVNWKKAEIIMRPAKLTNNWDNKGLYRGSLMYDGEDCYLFYSGISKKSKYVYEGVGILKVSDRWRNSAN